MPPGPCSIRTIPSSLRVALTTRCYVAEALLYEHDFEFSKHSAVHAAFGKQFAKTGLLDPKFHRWLLDAFDTRLQTDYGFEISIDGEHVEQMLQQATEFLQVARSFLKSA